MNVITFLEDEPSDLTLFDNRTGKRRKRPLANSFLKELENDLDRQVGQIFRSLPTVLLELQDDEPGYGKRRKFGKFFKKRENRNRNLLPSKNKFNVSIDTSNFSPDDITVKVVGKQILVSAKHEARSNDDYEYQEMRREITIPDQVDPDTITSRLSTDGQLTIQAPIKCSKDEPAERTLVIQRESGKNQMDKGPTGKKN